MMEITLETMLKENGYEILYKSKNGEEPRITWHPGYQSALKCDELKNAAVEASRDDDVDYVIVFDEEADQNYQVRDGVVQEATA